MTMKNKFLAAAAAISLIAASGSAYAQAEKKMDTQGGAKIEAQGQTGGAKVQGGAKTESQTGSSGTQMQTQGGAKTGQDTQRSGQAQQPSSQDSQSRQQSQDSSNDKPAQLSEQQRTQISSSISKQSNLKRVERSKINFTINVGSVVPRTIGLVPLPATLVSVVPAYRGYLYIVVGNELLIVHPRTYEIVAVIPA
jgi:preprotein translocase subunit SecF